MSPNQVKPVKEEKKAQKSKWTVKSVRRKQPADKLPAGCSCCK